MEKLRAEDFEKFFKSMHGHSPFPWQSMLVEDVIEKGWPDLINLPTASGKTACIDIGVFTLALAQQSLPRRIWFVVDRRIVVDEAYARALKLAATLSYVIADKAERSKFKLAAETQSIVQAIPNVDCPILRAIALRLRELGGSRPVEVGRLRGGAPRSIAWAGSPVQPAIITSTIDQVGSRLLFRGYGVSDNMKPVHAALAGNDSLIIVDEAHLAKPFMQTVAAVERFRQQPWAKEPIATPLKLVVMSATPPDIGGIGAPTVFPDASQRLAASNHRLLKQRMAASKPTELSVVKKSKAKKGEFPPGESSTADDALVVDAARRVIEFAASGYTRIAVMVNRVATARLIAEQLSSAYPNNSDGQREVEIVLLTGRLRPIDRDEIVRRYTPFLQSGSKEQLKRPLILVTTQCLEVGADFSFECLVSECASFDALRQRFGRLDRLGDSTKAPAQGVILTREEEIKSEDKLDDSAPLDPIYGNALSRTWNWLTTNDRSSIDMGITALQPEVDELQRTGALSPLLAPTRDAPVLLPAYLDLWSQTSPRPSVDPDVSLFLHGIPPSDERPRINVRVLWRNDLALLPENLWIDAITAAPPLSLEMTSLPLRELRAALNPDNLSAALGEDVEFGTDVTVDDQPETKNRSMVLWRGKARSQVVDSLDDIYPDDVIILPSDDPTFPILVPGTWLAADVYEQAFFIARGAPCIRFPAVFGPGRAPLEILDTTDDFDVETILEVLRPIVDELESRQERARLDSYLRKLAAPTLIRYADICWLLVGSIAPEPIDIWDSDLDADGETIYDTQSGSFLAEHTEAVTKAADHLSRLVPPDLRETICRAAQLHDVGKVDPRFQFILSSGRSSDPSRPRAKSDRRLPRKQERTLYEMSRLPVGFRHELFSMQIASAEGAIRNGHRELALHLIASHHGRCRPFAPVIIDDDPEAVCIPGSLGGVSISAEQRKQLPPHRLDSGVAERFWSLTRRYGWWGVAYLESILRLADMHASAFAERKPNR